MKTFVLILAMLAASLAAQNKQPQKTAPPQTAAQSASGQAAQQPQTVVKPTAKPVQPHSPQQLIAFTAKQLDEHENKILDQSEAFYNDRMTHLLWVMGILVGIGAVIVPLVVGVLLPIILERQRKISFTKELAQAGEKILESTKEQMKELEKKLISQIDDREAKQTIAISSNLSMIFSGLAGLLSSQMSKAGRNLMLQSHVLSMKFSIIAQCSGGCLPASEIIKLFTQTDIGSEMTLETLKAVDAEIEDMKGYLAEITDDKKRVDMESQVKELQTYVCALLHKKQQTTPPQAGPQEDKRT